VAESIPQRRIPERQQDLEYALDRHRDRESIDLQFACHSPHKILRGQHTPELSCKCNQPQQLHLILPTTPRSILPPRPQRPPHRPQHQNTTQHLTPQTPGQSALSGLRWILLALFLNLWLALYCYQLSVLESSEGKITVQRSSSEILSMTPGT
jgi:hypothetical protein